MVTVFKCGKLPFYLSKVSAGFPSPADDFLERGIDLNEVMIQHPSATQLVMMPDDSLQSLGIFQQDYLLLDKAITPKLGHLIACHHDGDLCVGELHRRGSWMLLMPQQQALPPDSVVLGVITWVIRRL